MNAAVQEKSQWNNKNAETLHSLQDLVKALQDQLKEERCHSERLRTALIEHWEMANSGAAHNEPLYPHQDLKEAEKRLDQLHIKKLRPLVKTEYEGRDGAFPCVVTEEIPYTPTELAKLQKECGHTQKESKTEYVCLLPLPEETESCLLRQNQRATEGLGSS